MAVIAAISFVIALILASRAIVRVPEGQVWIVERLGRYLATLQPGFHVRLLLVDRIARKHPLGPREVDSSDVAITLDNVPANVKSDFSWQIDDPEKATYAIADPSDFVTKLVRTLQRQAIGERNWNEVRETTRELQQAVLRATAAAAANAGLKIVAFNVRQIDRAS
jgi:regulator of protease activity HflC (stomatin/prohibitin superfamily)